MGNLGEEVRPWELLQHRKNPTSGSTWREQRLASNLYPILHFTTGYNITKRETSFRRQLQDGFGRFRWGVLNIDSFKEGVNGKWGWTTKDVDFVRGDAFVREVFS